MRSGSASVGFIGLALVFCVLRGPREKGWVGWRGGWSVRKRRDDRNPPSRPHEDEKNAGGDEEASRVAADTREDEKNVDGDEEAASRSATDSAVVTSRPAKNEPDVEAAAAPQVNSDPAPELKNDV